MHVGVADQAAEPPSALCLFQCLVVQPARSPHARGGCDRVVAFPSWASLQAASVTKPRRSCAPMRSKRVDSRHGRPREWTSSVRAPGWPCRAQRGPNWQPREPCGRWWSRNRGRPGNRPWPSLPSSQSGADAVVTRRPSPCRAVNAPSVCGRPCSSMRHSGQCVPGLAYGGITTVPCVAVVREMLGWLVPSASPSSRALATLRARKAASKRWGRASGSAMPE